MPSGLKWATCNVGANSLEEAGDYFAWGEVEPKKNYSWDTYKHGSGKNELTKYCFDTEYGKDGFTDDKNILDPEDDAASVNWGGKWRMPAMEEQQELILNCECVWTTENGVKGCKVIGKNGNSIFLPAAYYMDHDKLLNSEMYGLFWSSSTQLPDFFGSYKPCNANYMYCNSDGLEGTRALRYFGLSVCPVCP